MTNQNLKSKFVLILEKNSKEPELIFAANTATLSYSNVNSFTCICTLVYENINEIKRIYNDNGVKQQ